MKFAQTIIIILSLSLLPTIANSAGIEVSPSRLDFTINDVSSSQNIAVANPTTDVQIYQIYTDDFQNYIKINPSSFTLEAGGRKTVEIAVSPTAAGQKMPEIFATTLSVVGRPLADGRFSIATGVKIPLSAKISAQKKTAGYKNIPWFAGLIVILLGLVFYSNRTARLRKSYPIGNK